MKRRVWPALVVLVGIGAGFAIYRHRTAGESSGAGAVTPAGPADRPVPVVLAPVEKRDMPVHLDGLGTVLPLATVTVRPQVDGRLDKVLFTEGQAVKKGDVLAVIDARPFTAALHQAQAVLARDTALLANGKLGLDRLKSLREQNLVAQQDLDNQVATVAQTEAQVMADRAAAESARLSVEYATVRSPVDGVTGVRLVDQGNVVRASDAQGLVVVTTLDPITVVFTVPQDAIATVTAARAKGPLQVEALARTAGEPIGRGELSVIDNQIDPQTSMVKLKATMPNPQRALWPGAFVKARLQLEVRHDALVIPEAAVQRGPDGAFVYAIDGDDRAVQKPVQTERGDGEWVVVTQGLGQGERVVVDGQSQLRAGSKVVPRGGPS